MARDANPAKRRRNRVAVSCFSCRALKTKCDNVRPVCSTCARNGRQCTWMQEGIAGGSARDAYLRSLEKRLEAIEGSRQRTESSSRRHQLGDDTAHDVSKAHDVSCPRDTVASPALQHQGPSSIVVDANVSIGTSFTQLILRSIYGRGSTTHAVTTPDEMRASNQTGVFHDDLYALPANAAAVLNRYFEHRHLLTPLFHQPSAKVMFDAALNCPPQERYKHRPAFIILNMILALCTSHWLEDRATITARKHYDIAMALLQPTILREWSLECVQALLLGARYLQTTSRGDECWNVLGLAVRIAYGLRLHQEPPSTDPIPLRETKRRIWYVAYMLDMHWSMVYERPPSARSSDFSVSLPEDLDDDCIQEHRILFPSPRQPSNMSFFLQNVKLYRIVEKEITGTATPRNTAELVVSLDNDYQEWLRERPPHLILDIENPDNEPAWILALRGNMVCILIHRQSLELSLHKQQCRSEAPKPESSMADNILRASHRICVTAAIESIDIVELRHEQTKKTAGLDWYNIYYLFNAVITLVSYILNPLYSSDRHALDKMDKALHMIKSMSRNHSFAKWAHSFLQQLTSYMHQLLVPQQESQAQTQAAQVLSHASQDHTLASNGLVSLPATTTGAPAGFPDSSADPFQLDLQTIFGHAQDLSVNLETQLESFNAGDLAADPMWMFGDGGHGV